MLSSPMAKEASRPFVVKNKDGFVPNGVEAWSAGVGA